MSLLQYRQFLYHLSHKASCICLEVFKVILDGHWFGIYYKESIYSKRSMFVQMLLNIMINTRVLKDTTFLNTCHIVRSLPCEAKSLQLCPTLCNTIDSSLLGSSVPGFSRQEYWSGLPFPSPMHESESEITQSCPTLSDPMDCSLPGSPIHGIFQARVLEWVTVAFSTIC